tara:strand:+ start:832 stop:1047 length:216 start_codon:yes stop_codon:yes gene_type:complete
MRKEIKWKLVFWKGDNFRKWGWNNPCECGCDSRGDLKTPTSHYYLEKYFSGGLGLFGFSLMKNVFELKEDA